MRNLATLQELFEDSIFKVPDYQRGYTWTESNVMDLLEDLDNLPTGKEHYTGTFIFLSEGKKIQGLGKNYTENQVVDGQQRMTTLIILINNIVKILRNQKGEFNDKKLEVIISNLTKLYLIEDGEEVYKLTLDDQNDHFFKERILKGKEIEPQLLSHRRLIDADRIIRKYLEEKSKERKYIIELIVKITESLKFTVYYVTDESEVNIIFETMNDRGLQLTNLEKVKNHLLQLAGITTEPGITRKEALKHINSSWKNILRNLYVSGETDLPEDTLLRISVILKFFDELKEVRENGKVIKSINSQIADMYRLIKMKFQELLNKDKESCLKEILDYATFLERLSEKYRDISLPEGPGAFHYIQDKNLKERIKLAVTRYNRMGSQASPLPLIVSIYLNYSSEPEFVVESLELIEKVLFRVYGISSIKSNAGVTKLNSLAYMVYHGELTKEKLVESIKGFDKDYFVDMEAGLAYPNRDYYYDWEYLRYFLYEYELWRCQKNRGKPSTDWERMRKKDLNESVEHILPQTYPSGIKYWTDRFNELDQQKNSKRLGNLCLTDRNQYLSNKGFDEKKKIYKDSSWQIERDLADYDQWTKEEIDRREKEMIKFAEERWKI